MAAVGGGGSRGAKRWGAAEAAGRAERACPAAHGVRVGEELVGLPWWSLVRESGPGSVRGATSEVLVRAGGRGYGGEEL